MKITDRTELRTLFGELDNGNVFKYEDVVYMKIKEPYDSNYNAIRLFDGDVDTFRDDHCITPCHCELIIG